MYTEHIRAALGADEPNLSISFEEQFGRRIDYDAFLYECGDYAWVRQLIYLIGNGNGHREKFIDALWKMGYEPKVVSVAATANVSHHDVDVSVAVDAMALSDKIDSYVLGSGDGDYIPLVQALKARGVRVIVMGIEAATSRALIQEADEFIPITAAMSL